MVFGTISYMDLKKITPFAIVVGVILIGGYYLNTTKQKVLPEEVPIVKQTEIEDNDDLDSKFSVVIKQQANEMAQAFLKKDFKTFSNYTYPKLIELIGGEENYLKLLEQLMSGPDAPVFLKLSFGEPSKIINTGKELQAVLPRISEIKVSEGVLVSNSPLIALSLNNGKNWYFIDTALDGGIEKIRIQFPNISKDLGLPSPEEPILRIN
jgi:hypothetical protein